VTAAAPIETPKRFQNLTGLAGMVLVIAIFSVLANVGMIAWKPGEIGGDSPLPLLVPHLLVIALLSSGFRVFGEMVAVIVGALYFLLGVAMFFLSGLGGDGGQLNGSGGLLALLQVMIIVFALLDLWHSDKLAPQRINPLNRVIGLTVPLGVFLVAWAILGLVTKGDEARILSDGARTVSEERTRRVNAEVAAGAWQDKSQLPDLLRLAQCVERFRGDSIAGAAPKSLRAIYRWSTAPGSKQPTCGYEMYEKGTLRMSGIPNDTIPPRDTLPHPYSDDTHHVVYYDPPARLRSDPFHRAEFTLGIEAVWKPAEFPSASGRAGARSYLLDPQGNVHVTAEHRRATTADSIVPVCGPHETDGSKGRECRPAFESRQRWGVVPRLPELNVLVQDRIIQPDSAYAQIFFQQVSALDSARMVTVDWGDGRKPTVVSVPPARSINYITKRGNTYYGHQVQLFLHHYYKSLGWKLVHARLVSRAGAEYVATDSTFVEAPDPNYTARH
jgi:hypothetical protein